MKKSRCLVFGGGGFLGSHLVEQLVKNNYPVLVIGRGKQRDFHNLALIIKQIKYLRADINQTGLIKKIIKPQDIIFDLVASSVPYSSMQLPIKEINSHIFSHVQLIKTAAEQKAKKIIFFSTGGAIYQQNKTKLKETDLVRPASPHAISKAAIEYFLDYFSKIYSCPYIIYRISNVYGPRQKAETGFGIVPTLFNQVKKNQPPVLFNQGRTIRDYIYIDDAIAAVSSSFDKKTKYRLYNIGSGQGTSLNALWLMIRKITQSSLKPIYQPKRPIDNQAVVLNINRIKKEFSWQPKTSLKTGLQKTWSDY